MGKPASEISQELEQTRSDASEKIEKIEQQVTQSADSVKQSLDWRHQIDSRPLTALGTAFVGGIILGGMTGGGNGNSQQRHSSDGSNGHSSSAGYQQSAGLGGAIRRAAHTSGADEAVTSAVAAVLTTLSQRVKDAVEETYPGFLERYENSKSASGGVTDRMKAATPNDDATSKDGAAASPIGMSV